MSELDPELLRDVFIDFMNDEETQKFVKEFIDVQYDYIRAKVFGTIGGLQKGANAMAMQNTPSLIDRKGHLNLMGLLGLLKGLGQGTGTPEGEQPPLSNSGGKSESFKRM